MRCHIILCGFILILISLVPQYGAIETGMLISKEVNISLNLTSDYNISYLAVPTETKGAFGQVLLVNNVLDKTRTASLILLSYDDRSILSVPSGKLSSFMENMLLRSFKLAGENESDRYNVSNHYNQNVTILTLSKTDSGNYTSEKVVYVGFWPLDKLNYFFLLSTDKKLAKNIIEGLEVRDSATISTI
jgi:hypothetical protein